MNHALMAHALAKIVEERYRQFAAYGDNADLEYGTGPAWSWVAPLSPLPAVSVERAFRAEYEQRPKPTWMHLVREEVAEAFMENDPTRLAEELIQVAALCVSWYEKIKAKEALLS